MAKELRPVGYGRRRRTTSRHFGLRHLLGLSSLVYLLQQLDDSIQLQVSAFTSHSKHGKRNRAVLEETVKSTESLPLPPRVSGDVSKSIRRRPTNRRRHSQQRDGTNTSVPDSIPRLSEILEGKGIASTVTKLDRDSGGAAGVGRDSSAGSDTHAAGSSSNRSHSQAQSMQGLSAQKPGRSQNRVVVPDGGQRNPPKLNSESVRPHSVAKRKPRNDPWKAGYFTSLKSQKRIKSAAWSTSNRLSVDRAVKVLQTFLSIPPERCNAANLVCALTLSVKVMGSQTNEKFRLLFFQTMGILESLLATDSLSARQLCNVAWAIAKQYDRDEYLLPSQNEQLALSYSGMTGQAETWDLRTDLVGCPRQRVDRVVDEIASKLTAMLESDYLAAKEGELCMASWAYGVLRKRRRPPGWPQEPQLGHLPRNVAEKPPEVDPLDVIKFEQWRSASDEDSSEKDSSTPTDRLFDIIGASLAKDLASTDFPAGICDEASCRRVRLCGWNELANVAWAFASHGRSSEFSVGLLSEIAYEAARRLDEPGQDKEAPRSRDIAQLVWALGTLQADNYRLADSLVRLVDAAAGAVIRDTAGGNSSPLEGWSCADLVQMALALAHARLDDGRLLKPLYTEALRRLKSGLGDQKSKSETRKAFLAWELSILLWAQARLYLTSNQDQVFQRFAVETVSCIHQAAESEVSLSSIGVGSQEQANIAWSLAVLQEYNTLSSKELLLRIFNEAATNSSRDGVIQLEHAHQLWQALYLLEKEVPECTRNIPRWFYEALQEKWLVEKSRAKLSSARHRSISQTLNLMGVAHVNEHDEDIDVAIVLKPNASWTHETERLTTAKGMKVAVEFDGPNHFTRQELPTDGSRPAPPRTLGHTVLKYRLLKHQGWTVVRVPYYEFDKIPFWASMERQRYLQRLLKTHGDLRFSAVDVSEYKAPVSNRRSRFD